jgi:hypothetical protein
MPAVWPTPVFKVVLREFNFELNLYGGHDFKDRKGVAGMVNVIYVHVFIFFIFLCLSVCVCVCV